jgi:hypothetical protein
MFRGSFQRDPTSRSFHTTCAVGVASALIWSLGILLIWGDIRRLGSLETALVFFVVVVVDIKWVPASTDMLLLSSLLLLIFFAGSWRTVGSARSIIHSFV